MSVDRPNVGDLSVSVEDLDSAVTYIERLMQYVDDVINDEMARIKERMKGDAENPPVVPNATPFGAFEDARMQWNTLVTSTANMEASIKALSQKLAKLKAGTADIAKAYRDAEERNRASAKEIERILESAAVPQTPGTGPTYSPNPPNKML
jgi:hypothetical protein